MEAEIAVIERGGGVAHAVGCRHRIAEGVVAPLRGGDPVGAGGPVLPPGLLAARGRLAGAAAIIGDARAGEQRATRRGPLIDERLRRAGHQIVGSVGGVGRRCEGLVARGLRHALVDDLGGIAIEVIGEVLPRGLGARPLKDAVLGRCRQAGEGQLGALGKAVGRLCQQRARPVIGLLERHLAQACGRLVVDHDALRADRLACDAGQADRDLRETKELVVALRPRATLIGKAETGLAGRCATSIIQCEARHDLCVERKPTCRRAGRWSIGYARQAPQRFLKGPEQVCLSTA